MISSNKYFRFRLCEPLSLGAALGAAGISAVGNLVGGLIKGNTDAKISNATNKLNWQIHGEQMDLAREQMALQQDQFLAQQAYADKDWARSRQASLDDWIRETEYNSPAAQRARYEAAGINPALAMQGQNQAIAGMASVPGVGSPSPGGLPSVPGAPSMQGWQTENIIGSAVDSALRAASAYSGVIEQMERATGTSLDNDVKALTRNEQILKAKLDNREAEQRIKNMKGDESIKQMELRNVKLQGDLLDDTLALNNATFDARAKQISTMNYLNDRSAEKLNQDAIAQEIRNGFLRSKEILDLKLSSAQLDNIAQSIAESKSRVGLNNQMAVHTALQAAGIDPDTPQGRQNFHKIESELFKNRQVKIAGPFGIGTTMSGIGADYNSSNPLHSYGFNSVNEDDGKKWKWNSKLKKYVRVDK